MRPESFEQAECLAETKYGAAPNKWRDKLPRWLTDAKFARQFAAMSTHGAQFRHLSAGERDQRIMREIDTHLDLIA